MGGLVVFISASYRYHPRHHLSAHAYSPNLIASEFQDADYLEKNIRHITALEKIHLKQQQLPEEDVTKRKEQIDRWLTKFQLTALEHSEGKALRVFGYTPRTAAHGIRIAHMKYKLGLYRDAKDKVSVKTFNHTDHSCTNLVTTRSEIPLSL